MLTIKLQEAMREIFNKRVVFLIDLDHPQLHLGTSSDTVGDPDRFFQRFYAWLRRFDLQKYQELTILVRSITEGYVWMPALLLFQRERLERYTEDILKKVHDYYTQNSGEDIARTCTVSQGILEGDIIRNLRSSTRFYSDLHGYLTSPISHSVPLSVQLEIYRK